MHVSVCALSGYFSLEVISAWSWII